MAIGRSKGAGHQWATMYQSRSAEELYDLRSDPNEMNNLASTNEAANIKAKLSVKLDKWLMEQGDEGMVSEMLVPLKARDMSKVPEG